MQNIWIENNSSQHTVKVDIITRATLNISPKIVLFVQLVAEVILFQQEKKKNFEYELHIKIFLQLHFLKINMYHK